MSFGAEWSDFLSAPPVIDADFLLSSAITSPSEFLNRVQTDNLDSGILTWHGTNSFAEFTVMRFDASYLGTGTTGQQTLTVVGEGLDVIVLPLQSAGNWIEIWCDDSDIVPGTFQYSWVQRAGLYNNTIFGTSAYAIDETQTVATTDEGVFRPTVFVPAKHQLYMTTTAASWTLDFEYATTAMAYSAFRLASNTVPLPLGHTINGPASSWQLRFTNNDGGDRDFRVLAIREP